MYDLISDLISYLMTSLIIATPIAAIVLFIVSLCMFISSRIKEKQEPCSVSKGKLITWKVLLIVSSVVIGVFLLVVVAIIYLTYQVLLYM